MIGSLRWRFGMWLERFPCLGRYLYRYDGIAPSGFARAVNIVNGHSVLLTDDRRLIRPGDRKHPATREESPS